MSWLSLLLTVKILVTLVIVALPFLLLPRQKLEAITRMTVTTPLFFRLYGVAIFALLVGYSFGIPMAEAGNLPWGVVCMGVVSNGGAATFMISFGRGTRNILISIFFSLVTLGLLASLFVPDLVLRKVW